MYRIKKKYFLAALPVAILFFATIYHFFQYRTLDLSIPDCTRAMTWAHASNGQDRVQSALVKGFCGVELDVHYHPEGYFVVAHDDLSNSAAPRLESILNHFSETKMYWWLDFKNLSFENAENAAVVLKNFERFNNFIFVVESHNFFGLWRLPLSSHKKVFKAYWASVERKGILRHAFDKLRIFAAVLLINPSIVSMNAEQAEAIDDWYLFARHRFAFTVNASDQIKMLFENGFSVILTDSPELSYRNGRNAAQD